MTAVDERTDELVGSALDFAPELACDRKGHPSSAEGCDSAEPARWIALVGHIGTPPHDKPAQMLLCPSSVEYLNRWLNDLFSTACPCGEPHPSAVVCALCGTIVTDPRDMLTIIGEV